MTDKRKIRVRAVANKLGKSHRGAANALDASKNAPKETQPEELPVLQALKFDPSSALLDLRSCPNCDHPEVRFVPSKAIRWSSNGDALCPDCGYACGADSSRIGADTSPTRFDPEPTHPENLTAVTYFNTKPGGQLMRGEVHAPSIEELVSHTRRIIQSDYPYQECITTAGRLADRIRRCPPTEAFHDPVQRHVGFIWMTPDMKYIVRTTLSSISQAPEADKALIFKTRETLRAQGHFNGFFGRPTLEPEPLSEADALQAQEELENLLPFLDRFLHDPLPAPDVIPVYDYHGPAVWLGPDGKPTKGIYNHTPLPLLPIPPDELEAIARSMFTLWGNPSADPQYTTRHPEFNGLHNLLIYNLKP